MLYELWKSELEESYLFLSRDNNYEKVISHNKQFTPDLKLIWTYNAKSHFEAMQAYYDHLGFGVYKPEPDWEDIIYK